VEGDVGEAVAGEAWQLLAEIFHGTESRNAAISADFGLTNQQGLALTLLRPHEPIRMSELARKLHCANSQLTVVVDRLEQLGVAQRVPGQDRREKLVQLTPEGIDVRAAALVRYHEPPPQLMALPPDKQRALRDLLAEALHGATDDSPPATS
jgi:DNA-binding MarR family transcriptional regulator